MRWIDSSQKTHRGEYKRLNVVLGLSRLAQDAYIAYGTWRWRRHALD